MDEDCIPKEQLNILTGFVDRIGRINNSITEQRNVNATFRDQIV